MTDAPRTGPLYEPHDTPLRVRYDDTDRMGVVYHGKFFSFFDQARTEWLRARGIVFRDLEAKGAALVVADARARYLAPARYDDLLTVRTTLVAFRHATIDFRYEVLRDGTRLAEGETRLVSIDAGGKATRLPEELRALARGEA